MHGRAEPNFDDAWSVFGHYISKIFRPLEPLPKTLCLKTYFERTFQRQTKMSLQ